MTSVEVEITELGDALQRAIRREHALQRRAARQRKRRLLIAALAVAVVLPAGGTLASNLLVKSPAEEEIGLLDADATFAGTKPLCIATGPRAFRCTIDHTPTGLLVEGSYVGVKVASVDSADRIDGGCIGRSVDGKAWDCYLGQAAVTRGIVDAAVLGSLRSNPAHG